MRYKQHSSHKVSRCYKCYLFYFIWWELLHILQFVNTLTMAIIITEEIISALFQ